MMNVFWKTLWWFEGFVNKLGVFIQMPKVAYSSIKKPPPESSISRTL